MTTFYRLLSEHGTAQNALAALPEVARAAGVDGYEICPAGVIDGELRFSLAPAGRTLETSHLGISPAQRSART